MSASVPTPDTLIDSFPSAPDPIKGIPSYETLTFLRNSIKQNAASVPSNRGGGQHGYLGIVLTDAMYATIAPTPFVVPPYPGAQPNIAANATGAQISEAVRLHTENLREWREFTNVTAALRKQVLEAVEPVYLRAIKTRHVGFANRSIREIFAYLFTNYGRLTPQRLTENNHAMNKAWDPSTPFETVIDQLEEAMEVADAAGQPFTDPQVLTIAYTLVYNTGLYFDDTKTWNAKAEADKTWDNFKTHFLLAQTELLNLALIRLVSRPR